MKYTVLLLDIDDTILNFQSNEKQALTRIFQDYHIDNNQENWALYHRINRQLWEDYEEGRIERDVIFKERFTRFFSNLGLEADGVVADQTYRRYLDEGHDVMPEAKEILEILKGKGYRLFAATNGVASTQYRRLKDSQLYSMFDAIYISEEIGFQKPDERFFETIFQEHRLHKDDVLMIGDTLSSDIRGGNRYGIDTVWYDWKNQSNPNHIQPTYTIHHLSELLQLL